MQVGSFGSLTDMVKGTPVFHQAELETFQKAAVGIVEQAEGLMTGTDEYRRTWSGSVTQNMRDLQGALRAGFPVTVQPDGSRRMECKLPGDLTDTLKHLNEAMPLYLALASGVPLPAPVVLAPREQSAAPVVIQIENPMERALERLEAIRNEIQDAAVKPDA